MLKKNKEGEDWSALLDVVPSMVLCVNRICDNYAFSKYRRCRYDVEEKIKIDSGQQKGVDGGDNR
mgnify:CR=1 FL=1